MLNSVFLFFSFSGSEIMLILFVALILFGGDKFPEIARGLGKGIREFKDMSDGVKREIHSQINNYDLDPNRSNTNTNTTPVTPSTELHNDHYTEDTRETPVVPYEAQVASHEPQVSPHEEHPVTAAPHEPVVETPRIPDPNQPPNTISHQSY